MTRGNQRDTNRIRAAQRAAKAPQAANSRKKDAESDAAIMRAKQQAALQKKEEDKKVDKPASVVKK